MFLLPEHPLGKESDSEEIGCQSKEELILWYDLGHQLIYNSTNDSVKSRTILPVIIYCNKLKGVCVSEDKCPIMKK